jgi:hypothetical protein
MRLQAWRLIARWFSVVTAVLYSSAARAISHVRRCVNSKEYGRSFNVGAALDFNIGHQNADAR